MMSMSTLDSTALRWFAATSRPAGKRTLKRSSGVWPAPTKSVRWKTSIRETAATSTTTHRTQPAATNPRRMMAMSLRKLPEIKALQKPKNFQADAPGEAFEAWAAQPKAAGATENNVISIFDIIGEDWWTGEGFTAKRCSAALRSIGNADVRVQINSPGGDVFEGLAIYNLLRAHPAKVTVEIMGIAASAASIVAMAGDEIVMGLGTFVMVHNAWGVVVGNRHELAEASSLFETF